MVYTGRHYLPNLLQKESTLTLDPPSAAQLLAPWPDIVLDCGKRSVPVARWIKKQSGGRTRLVHLGRPWGAFDWFDLIVTTPQYRVPPRANVQVNAVPMNRPSQSALDEAVGAMARAVQSSAAALDRPDRRRAGGALCVRCRSRPPARRAWPAPWRRKPAGRF